MRENLNYGVNLGAFKSKPPRHDQTYVPRTENNYVSANHHVLQVNEVLSHTRRVHPSRACPRNANLSAGSLTTPHSKNNSLSAKTQKPRRAGDKHLFVRRNLKHHTVKHTRNAHFLKLINVPLSVLWTSQLFFEEFKAKAVMDALGKDAAEPIVPFYDHQILNAVFLCVDGCGEPCWTSTNHNQINVSTCEFTHFFRSPSSLWFFR